MSEIKEEITYGSSVQIRDAAGDKAMIQCKDRIDETMWLKTVSGVGAQVMHIMYDQILLQVQYGLQEHLCCIKKKAWVQIAEQVIDQMDDKLWQRTYEKPTDQIRKQVTNKIRVNSSKSIHDRVSSLIEVQLESRFKNA